MNKLLATALAAATLTMSAQPALADELVRESRAVDAKVTKVKLGGVVDLTVRQGATPSLVVSGDRDKVAKLTTTLQGDTLQIDTGKQNRMHIGWSSHDLKAELIVPNLSEFVSQGVGGSRIVGFDGDSINVSLDGAGSVTIESRYRNVEARLGGVGGLTLNGVDAERMDLSLRGAGRIHATGQAKQLRAKLSGVGSLDAAKLRADSVDLDLSGMGGAEVYAKSSATVSLSGMGSATVYGNPASRTSNGSGMGKVSWK